MTVPVQDPINVSKNVNGVTSVFPYNFRILAAADLYVEVNGVVQLLNVHYTVDGVGNNSGGNVTFAPLYVPPAGSTVIRQRLMDYERTDDFQVGGELRATEVNKNYDAPVMMIQQLAQVFDLVPRLPVQYFGTDMTFPPPEAGRVIGWNADATGLRNTDLSGPGDLLLRSDLSDPTAGASLVAFRQSGTGAQERDVMEKARERVSVKDFGATGNGITDDSAAIQAAVNYVRSVGGDLYFPHGAYLLGSTVTIDLTLNAVAGRQGINIYGDGSGNTKLINATNNIGVDVLGTMESFALYSYFRCSGLMITKIGAGVGDIGMQVRRSYGVYMDDVVFDSNTMGFKYFDCVLMTMVSCHFRWNSYGLLAAGQQALNGSTPNAVTFVGCIFYGQGNYAAWFEEGCNVVFIGGSVESTRSGSDPNKFGLRFNHMGRYGSAAVQIWGTYFEVNGNVADIWINAGDYSCSYIINGATFNRLTNDPLLGGFTEHNIRFETNNNTAARQSLTVEGCAFARSGTYVASAARPYIQVYGSTPVEFRDVGNRYMDNIERPTKESVDCLARATFNGSTAALIRQVNVISVAKNGTGDYTVNFRDSNTNLVANRTVNINADVFGSGRVVSQTATSVRIAFVNLAGAAVDPGQVYISVWE